MINHEPEGISNVALKSHDCLPREQLPEVDFSPLERSPYFWVRLEFTYGDLDKGTDALSFVAPEGTLVGYFDRMDGFESREVLTLSTPMSVTSESTYEERLTLRCSRKGMQSALVKSRGAATQKYGKKPEM